MAAEPEPEAIRQTKRLLRLTDAQYQYLTTGELTGSYADRPDKLEARISDTLALLPRRFELLFEDIGALSRNYYFETDEWEEAWIDLMNLHRQEPIQGQFEFDPTFRDASQAAKFGQEIGRMVERVMKTPRGTSTVDIWTDLVDGFIEGLCFGLYHERQTDTEDFRREILDSILSTVEARHASRARAFEAYRQADLEDRAAHEQAWDSKLREILAILEEQALVGDEWRNRDAGPRVDSIAYWLASAIYWEMYPEQGMSPAAIDELVTPEAVMDVVRTRELETLLALRGLIQDDIERLREKSGRGPSPTALLEEIFENGPGSSGELAARLDDDRVAGITETARDLAGTRDPSASPRDVWTERPLLTGDTDSWDTTPYGEAVGYVACEQWDYGATHFLPEDVFEAVKGDLSL